MKGQKVLLSSNNMEWETPQKLFDELNKEFNFSIDLCATKFNSKIPRYIGNIFEFRCGFKETYYMNPPYGREIGLFISRALHIRNQGNTVICLVPARVDTKWWSLFWDHETHKPRPGIEVRFIKGRLKFELNGIPTHPAPFPSAIVIMKGINIV